MYHAEGRLFGCLITFVLQAHLKYASFGFFTIIMSVGMQVSTVLLFVFFFSIARKQSYLLFRADLQINTSIMKDIRIMRCASKSVPQLVCNRTLHSKLHLSPVIMATEDTSNYFAPNFIVIQFCRFT